MKKLIIVIMFFFAVLIAFTSCMALSHAGHSSGTSQHSGGCH